MSELPLPPPAIASRARSYAWVGDTVGSGVVASLAAWYLVAWSDDGGRLAPVLLLLGSVAGAYALGRALSTRVPVVVPIAVVLAVGVVAAPHLDEIVNGAPLAHPLGYANANAALLFQAAIAAVMIAALAPNLVARVAAISAAVLFAAVAIASGSEAVAVLLIAAIPMLAIGVLRPVARWMPLFLGTVLVGTIAATAVLGAVYEVGSDQPPAMDVAIRVLSERRLALWHDAWVITLDHPIAGVGPGRFAEESPTAAADPDAAWAHEEFVQSGAEAGIPGLLLLAAVFLWALARLRSRDPSPAAVVAAVGVTALGLHASIDYVLHFWAVPVLAAALVGVAVSRRTRSVA